MGTSRSDVILNRLYNFVGIPVYNLSNTLKDVRNTKNKDAYTSYSTIDSSLSI
jgi:hypothetical protein